VTPRVRRRVAIGAAVGVIGIGVAVLAAVAPSGSTAMQSMHAACMDLTNALRARGQSIEVQLRDGSVAADSAAAKQARFQAFAAAVARLAGRAPTPAVVVARPSDLATAQATCGGGVVPHNDAIVVRAPYLTDVTADSALVNFATDGPVNVATVNYGNAQDGCHLDRAASTSHSHQVSVAGRTDYLVSVRLTSLRAGGRYCYQAGGGVFELSTLETPATFSTPPLPTDQRALSFAVIGDFGGGSTDESNVLRQIALSPALFIVTVGDNAYEDGTQANYGDLAGGNVFGPDFWPQVGETRPTFAAQGNHGFTNYRAGLTNWPETNVVRASGGRYQRDVYCCLRTLTRAHPYPSDWYAFNWGPARFYVLDAAWADATGHYTSDALAHWNRPVPACTPCGMELTWLRSDLAAHADTPLKFAFFHYPLHVNASDHQSDVLLDGPTGLEGLLAHAGVDIVFNGHAHLYERNRPQIAGSPMVSYVTGGGGVNDPTDTLAAVAGCSAFDAYAIGADHTSCNAAKPHDNSDVYHYLLVTVAGHRVTITPTNETGQTFDVQTYAF